MNKRILVLALLTLAVLVAACGAKEATEAPQTGTLDGKALAEERCAVCHDYGRVEGATKSADGWKANVERMVAHGAQLNAEEQAAVIAYLAEAFPE